MQVTVLSSSFPRFSGDFKGSFVSDQVSCLTSLGVNVKVVTPSSAGASDASFLPFPVVRYRYLPRELERMQDFSLAASHRAFIEWPFYLAGATRSTITQKSDILHAHWAIPFGLVGSLVRLVHRRPMVVTCHGNDVTIPWLRPKYRFALRASLKSAEAVICVAQHLRRKLLKMGLQGNRILNIPIGIDTSVFDPSAVSSERFPAIPYDKKIVGTLASLLPNKRIHDLVHALPLVTSKRDNTFFAVGGEGPEMKHLVEMVSSSDRSEIVFLGRIARRMVPNFLRRLDVFVLPSATEGLSISLQEAMAMGSIPVVSDSIECHELIEHEHNGFYYKSGSPHDLAKKIVLALDRIDEVRPRVREVIVERFDLKENTKILLRLYKRLLDGMGPPEVDRWGRIAPEPFA